jgi:hypothetical protein
MNREVSEEGKVEEGRGREVAAQGKPRRVRSETQV